MSSPEHPHAGLGGHDGYAVTTEVLGRYVTVLCGDPEIAAAVAEALGNGCWGPKAATLRYVPQPEKQHDHDQNPRHQQRGYHPLARR
jgi:hypothetical protein